MWSKEGRCIGGCGSQVIQNKTGNSCFVKPIIPEVKVVVENNGVSVVQVLQMTSSLDILYCLDLIRCVVKVLERPLPCYSLR